MPMPPWHRELWNPLQARRAREALPHALLLAGAAGLGKRDFADRLARGLLCADADADAEAGTACGRCRACALLDAGAHPDRFTVTFELNTAGNPRKEIVVSQIRALSEQLTMASQFGGWKVASIQPADAMNPAAANALLKTLEEPAAGSMIVLIADAPWRLPATVRSRCQRIDFRLPPRPQALAWLREAGVENSAAALAAASGNPGLARAWAEQGLLDERRQVRSELVDLAGGRGDVYTVAHRWSGDDAAAQRLWFAAQLAATETHARAAEAGETLGSRLDTEALSDWFDRANRARESLRGTLRPDLIVLDLLSQWR